MKNYIAIFAHFDKDNIIDDYAIEYLKGLKEVAKEIIFVSDCNLEEKELKKLDGLCFDFIAQKHGEYDFGSWKRGLLKLKDLEVLDDYDGLIMANDSCYLISSLVPIFEEMEKRNSADFWGVAQSHQYGVDHIQSYFMVFNKKTLNSIDFFNFFKNVKKLEQKEEVIKAYEIGLSDTLFKKGFKKDSFFKKISFDAIDKRNLLIKLIPNGMPFIKVGLLLGIAKISHFDSFISQRQKRIITNNLVRRIGYRDLLESYSLNCFRKVFLHKKIFTIFIKNKKLIIKIFGIKILKINLN